MNKHYHKKYIYLFFMAFISIIWFFFGTYTDREHGDTYLFLKYKASIKFFFVSPLGEADRSYTIGKEGYLTPEMEVEENAYNDFIRRADHNPKYKIKLR